MSKRVSDETYEDVLSALGIASVPLSRDETRALQKRWREAFAFPLRKRTGLWTAGDFDWHVFSGGDAYSITGEQARLTYRGMRGGDFLILPNLDEGLGCRCTSASPPALDGKASDVYITPSDFSWTMVFTHEDGWLGPYFTTRDWVASPPPPPVKDATKEKKRTRRGSRR